MGSPTLHGRVGFLSPLELAKYYREENPGKFDDIDDAALVRAIEVEDPDSYQLIDPQLIGAENLAPIRTPAPRKAPQLIPPPPSPSTFDLAATTGLRVVPAIAGAYGGSLIAPGYGTYLGGMGGAGLGEGAAQWYEKTFGPREDYSVPTIAMETILGAFNPAARATTTLGRIGAQGAYGAGLGAIGGTARTYLEENRLPTLGELTTQTLAGGAFGAATHAGFEGASAARRALEARAPSFGDATGALPTDLGPPPSPLDQLVMARAAAAQHQAEEQRLASELTAMFGERAVASGSTRADFHTASQAKDYLEQIAQLRQAPVPIPPMDPTAWGPEIPPYLNRAIGLEGPTQLPARAAGAPPDFVAYPPGEAPPPLDQVGSGPGIAISSPPPDPLEEALAASLAAPPGSPRLVREKPYQALTLEAPEAAGTAELAPPPSQPSLFRQPRTPFPGRTEAPSVAELGGAPPTLDQPRLPGITTPRPLDRVYAEGPNAGPRRRGEIHGQPRTLRRQVEVEGKTRYEAYPSARPAEDPATYPPAVRRELAAMAWELDEFRHENIPGGSTTHQLEAIQQELGGDISQAIAEARKRGATAGGAIPGAPVYHQVIEAAEGGFRHVTRADMLAAIREAVLKGRGTGLTDAAAAVARARLAERGAGPLARGSKILAKGGHEGDTLIGWEDPLGHRAERGQALDGYQQAARELDDGEVLTATRIWQEAGGETGIHPDTVPFFQAAREEAVRRGLITPEQLELRMLGPGGEGGPPITAFEGEEGMPPPRPSGRKSAEEEGPPPPDRIQKLIASKLGEEGALGPPPDYGVPLFGQESEGPPPPHPSTQREPLRKPPEFLPVEEETGDVPLPGLEKVRMEERLMPELGQAPPSAFDLESPPGPSARQPGLFDRQSLLERLKSETGALFLERLPPAGDRSALKKWLKKVEADHGGEAWYSRVEQAIEDGDWDKAWKVAAAAYSRAYTKAYAATKTPQEEAALAAAVKGTVLQQDLPAQIVAVGRAGQQKRPAPAAGDLPPSYKLTTRQAGQGMELGPAGLIHPGPPTLRPKGATRATTLDRDIMDTFVEELADTPELLHLVRGNRDAALRLGRQVTDLVVQGQVKFDPADFPGMTREEVGRQYMHTLSEAGRILGAHGNYVQQFSDELHEVADRLDMGAALAGTLGSGRRAPRGARGRVSSQAAAEILDQIAEQTSTPQVTRNLLLNTLQKPPKRTIGDKLIDSQYSFLTSGFATAARNAYTTVGRYSWDLLDHALTIPYAAGLGEPGAGRTAGALLRERVGSRHTGFAVSPLRAAKAETFEQLYNIQSGMLEGMSQTDARRTLKILSEYPDEAAHMIGFAGGEQLATEGSGSVILDTLLSPKVQRWLTLWNRAQEYTGRGLTFDTHFRAQIRARGRDPVEALMDPSRTALAEKFGGDREVQDMVRYASNAALEMTWAGQLANRSVPAALVNFVQSYWPAKLVQRFPRFNFSAAPRWIWDHSPAALLDLVRLPFDNAGWTSTGKHLGGGRLYRGLQAQQFQTDVIPGVRAGITRTQGELGGALLELQNTSREWAIRQRQITRLQARAQQSLPGTQSALDAALTAQDILGRRRDRLRGEIKTHKTTIQDLTAQEEQLWKEVQNATGISAPTWSSWMARMTSGTFGLLGAAIVVRSQPGAEGTRFYQYRVDREGKDPYMLDLRAAAPFVQYLMVGDVLVDFWRHTNWDQAGKDAEAAGPTGRGNPLNWTTAMWNNYEGKYTKDLLGAEFAQAFLSISRAAGTSLTIADLMTRNGWPGPNEAADAIIGTIGQFLAGYATPLGQVKDVIGEFSPEEAQVRNTPRPSTQDPASTVYPLAEGLGRVPGASRLIPPTYSQTTGEPVRSIHPGVRALTGVGGTQADFVQEEVRRVGLSGSSVYFKETGDYGLDTLLAQTYARVLRAEMPAVLEDPDYRSLGTPAAQRDYLQKVFPLLKRAALGEVKELLGTERVETAQTSGEELRRKKRQAALLERLEAAEPRVETAPFEEPEPAPPGPPPPGPPPNF
jgi:hypothetical protein